MNIDFQIKALQGPDPQTALQNLEQMPRSQTRQAVGALIRQTTNKDPAIARQAMVLAADIGPQNEADFTALLQFLLPSAECGYMVPRITSLLENEGPHYPDAVEDIARALAFPHVRVRLAAIRAVSGLGELIELIEPQILAALDDKCRAVITALVQMLRTNFQYLPETLEAAIPATPPNTLDNDTRRRFEALEKNLWSPRALALNGTGKDDEDIVLALRPLDPDELEMDAMILADNLAAEYDLPSISKALGRIKHEDLATLLAHVLRPLNPDASCAVPNIGKVTAQLLELFDKDVKPYSNCSCDITGVTAHHPVTWGIRDGGVFLKDRIRMGIFWVSDAD
jgi:hypothetical protein